MKKPNGRNTRLTTQVICIFGMIIAALALSGVGYPNDSTVIIGPDSRGSHDQLYNLSLELPSSVSEGGVVQARVSIEHIDGFNVESHATVTVTGGSLQNTQTQELSPDALWKIQSSSDALVGVVVNVETVISPKGKDSATTTYLDTLSGGVSVKSVNATLSEGTSTNIAGAFDVKRSPWLAIGVTCGAIIMAALLVFVVLRKKKRNKTK